MATTVSTKCVKCGKDVTLGKDAISTPRGDQCDTCANVVRDVAGMAWTASPQLCMCFDYEGDNPDCPIHDHAGA